MKDLTWKDGALFALAYGIGYSLHEAAARMKEKAKIEGGPEGFEIGAVTGAISAAAGLVFDSREFADIGVGMGSGIATNDLVWHFKKKERFRKMFFMGEAALVDRWTNVIEIDSSLSDDAKEAIVIPLIRDLGAQCAPAPPQLCHPQFALPADIRALQLEACHSISSMLRINPMNPAEMVKVQRWLQLEGVGKGGYEPDESMTSPDPALRRPDVDRFRLPSLLLAKWMQTGKIPFDCDDGTITVNGMSWYNGIGPYAVVISQYPDRHLHHIAPAVDMGGQIVVLETIKYGLPPFRIEDAKRVFAPLTRMVLVHPSGRYEDLNVR